MSDNTPQPSLPSSENPTDRANAFAVGMNETFSDLFTIIAVSGKMAKEALNKKIEFIRNMPMQSDETEAAIKRYNEQLGNLDSTLETVDVVFLKKSNVTVEEFKKEIEAVLNNAKARGDVEKIDETLIDGSMISIDVLSQHGSISNTPDYRVYRFKF